MLMLSLPSCSTLLLVQLTITLILLKCAGITWPAPHNFSVSLLGLFPDGENISFPTDLSVHSRAMFRAALIVAQQNNITAGGQFIGGQSVQTGGDATEALRQTCDAISNVGTVGLVGPALSHEAPTIASFADRIGLPVVSYAATDADLSDRNTYPTFYRTAPSDTTTATALVQLFHRYNWTSCVIIHQNDAFGSGGVKAISEAFLADQLTIHKSIAFDTSTQTIQGDLNRELLSSSTRIVVAWMHSADLSVVLQAALDADVLGPAFTWILSSSNVSFSSFDRTFDDNLAGILTLEPVTGNAVGAVVNTTLLEAAYRVWERYESESFPGPGKVNLYALFTFDATWSLLQSLQQYCSTEGNNRSSCLSFVESSSCFDRRLVQSASLLNTIDTTEFLGVSGPVRFGVHRTDRVNGSYYHAQNLHRSSSGLVFVPVLEYADPGQWKEHSNGNTIIWPGNSLIPPSGFAGLQGVRLRIGVIASTPFTIVNSIIDQSGQNTTQLTGYIPDLIGLLQSQMGFLADIQLAPTNQTYAGLIQAVVSGTSDIVVGDVTVTSTRRKLVSFSSSIFDSSLRLVVRKSSGVDFDLVSFLKPFSRSLWLLVLAATLFGSVLVCCIEQKENEALQTISRSSKLAMSLWFAIGTIMGYGADYQVRTASGRVLTIGLYMLSMVLVATYTANLASNLTLSRSKNTITGIDDIKNGKVPLRRVGVRVGTAGESYFLDEISDGNRNYYPLQSVQDMVDSLLSSTTDVCLMDGSVAEYLTNQLYCNLTIVGEALRSNAFAIVIPQNWVYAQDLDVQILSLREVGTLDDLKKKWFQTENCPDGTDTSTAMKVESLGGLFSVFGMTCLLALVLFLWKKRPSCLKCRKRVLFNGSGNNSIMNI